MQDKNMQDVVNQTVEAARGGFRHELDTILLVEQAVRASGRGIDTFDTIVALSYLEEKYPHIADEIEAEIARLKAERKARGL